jgi:hypothetical protein
MIVPAFRQWCNAGKITSFAFYECQEFIDKHVPSKMTSVRYSQAWINTEIKRLSRRKQNAYNKAKASKKTKDWDHSLC